MMNEKPEVDEGKVTLCNVRENADGALSECDGYSPKHAWKVPSADGNSFILVPLKATSALNMWCSATRRRRRC